MASVDKKDVVWGKTEIQSMLSTNDKAVYRAVALIYKNQTDAEKRAGLSTENNGIGFTKFDAAFMKEVLTLMTAEANIPQGKFCAARNRIKKYWKQILKDMENRGYQVKYR